MKVGFEKPSIFLLKISILYVCGYLNNFISNCVAPWCLWPSKIEVSKLMGDIIDFWN